MKYLFCTISQIEPEENPLALALIYYFEKIIENNCFAFGIFPLYMDIAL